MAEGREGAGKIGCVGFLACVTLSVIIFAILYFTVWMFVARR